MNPSTWCLVVIYIGYLSAVNSLYWDIKSILEFDYEGANTLIGPNNLHSKLIFLDDTVYED